MKHQITPESPVTPPVGQPPSGSEVDTATLELLSIWRTEDATDNPEKVRAAEREVIDFKRAINESRAQAGQPLLYP